MESISENRKLTIVIDYIENLIIEFVKLNYDDMKISDHDFRIALRTLIETSDYFSDQLTEIN